MPRLIAITDDRKRDTRVAFNSTRSKARVPLCAEDGTAVKLERFIRSTDRQMHSVLLSQHSDAEALAQAIIAGDPELDLELAGRRVGETDRVWLRADGTVIYSARVLEVVTDIQGEEKSRKDFVDLAATVGEEDALVWGKLIPIKDAVRRFVFGRQLQLQHVDGLTYDYLQRMAQLLHDAEKMALLTAKGNKPIILHKNGAPFRGFLEGRVEGSGYRLVMHLSNLELKRVPT
ncbi:MAG: hypothetical protein RBU37_08305 [Myxococcota bacterium]|jgi:hypothetical protein|nr:hypothetical protein [Myxococcota bacterium]